MTGGRGLFTMEFSHYDEVPAQTSQKLIEEINKAKEWWYPKKSHLLKLNRKNKKYLPQMLVISYRLSVISN